MGRKAIGTGRPPAYPPPATPVEGRDMSEAVRRDMRIRYSALERSGYQGAWALAALIGVTLIVGNVLILRSGERWDTSFSVVFACGHLGAIAIILWGISVAREHRRARRRVSGQCVRCGFDLRGSSGGVCPECGAGKA